MQKAPQASPSSSGSFALIQLAFSLSSVLISLFLFVVGHFFFTALVSITLQQKGYGAQVIGWIQSGYFLGLLLGAMFSEGTVFRIGHIRSFTAGTALLIVSMLGMSFTVQPLYWFVMRMAAGVSLAVMFIVIESWLLDHADETNRGAVLSIYMTFYYLSQTLSQFFYLYLKEYKIDPYAAGATCCALAIIPLSLTFSTAPHVTEMVPMSVFRLWKKSPFGLTSSILGGIILSILYTYVPVTGISNGYDGVQMLALVIAGGSLLQFPIGKVSDLYERRFVLFVVASATTINALLLFLFFSFPLVTYILLFTLGGLTFTLYPLGISQCCDHIAPKNFMQAAAALLIAYGVGSSAGPFLGAQAISLFSYEVIFPFIAMLSFVLVAVGYYSIRTYKSIAAEDQISFSVAPTTSPLAATELNAQASQEEVLQHEQELAADREERTGATSALLDEDLPGEIPEDLSENLQEEAPSYLASNLDHHHRSDGEERHQEESSKPNGSAPSPVLSEGLSHGLSGSLSDDLSLGCSSDKPLEEDAKEDDETRDALNES